ncbi:MAG: porin [Planctomycetes bacterium]|nr:porin [Planctomycetota bacterium]
MLKLLPCRGVASIAFVVFMLCAAQSRAIAPPGSGGPSYQEWAQRQAAASASAMPSQAGYLGANRPGTANPVVPVQNMQPLPGIETTNRLPPPYQTGAQYTGPPADFSSIPGGNIPTFLNPVQPVSHFEQVADCNCEPLGRYGAECLKCTERAGMLPHDMGGILVGGWLQQGFTSNYGVPSDRMNSPVGFNDRSNDYRLNQLYLYAEKAVRRNGHAWGFGGRADVLLGSDARFLTVPGLERHRDGTPKWNGETSDYGLAIPQAYVEVAAPWLRGVSLKAGHFYSIAGYETAAAPENFFYSHAYTYLYGEPFTHTGALFTINPNDSVTLHAGYTNGWDVFDSTSNENGVLGGITIRSSDRRTSLAATVHSGMDVTGVRAGGALIDENRHFYSLVLQHQINDCWRYVFQHDFGYQEDAEVVVNTGPTTITFNTGKWYGINQYLIYDVNDQMSAAVRAEWFRDQDHSRIGIPVVFNPGGPTFLGGNYFALTGGLNWRPHTNVTVRPEIRWDYSDLKGNGAAPGGDPNFRTFDDNRSSSQVTAAIDVVLFY